MIKSAFLQITITREPSFLFSVKASLIYLILLIFLLLIPFHTGLTAFGESKCTIYFYNPESNIDNYASLKTKFDLYLKKIRHTSFNPSAIEKLLRTKPEVSIIAFLSSQAGIIKN